MKTLSDVNKELEESIVSVVERGNHFHGEKSYEQALEEYNKAWGLLPEPKLDWEITSWVSKCIYSSYFDVGDFHNAKKWAEISLQTRGSNINTAPLINLGMVCYELKEYDVAYKYFHDVYVYGKKRAFQGRPKKYLDFYLKTASKS